MTTSTYETDGEKVAEITKRAIAGGTVYNLKLYQNDWEVANLNYDSQNEADEKAADWANR